MASGRSIWADLLSDAERSALNGGAHVAPDSRPDVLIVGGGIVGVATALACQMAGLGRVSLVEAGALGSGATSGAAGLLVPESHQGSDPDAFVDMARTSLKLWRELDGALPGGVGFQDMDWLGLAPHPEGFQAHPPDEVEWLSAADVAVMVPGLAGEQPGALVRHQGRVNPLRAVVRMAAQLSGVATGVPATGCQEKRGAVVAISTTAGTVSPGAVIFATGGPPQLAGLDLDLPSDFVKGHLAATAPVSVRLAGSVAPLATQIEDGRLLIGGTVDSDDSSPEVNPEVIDGISGAVQRAWPLLGHVDLSYQWCCWRPHHPDSLPVIDQVPGLANAWFTSGHYRTGILMAPATAGLLCEWVRTGKRPELAARWGINGRWLS